MLIVTAGDPFSVTVETLAPLLSTAQYRRTGCVVIGSAWQWQDQARRAGVPLPAMTPVTSVVDTVPGQIAFFDVGTAADARPAEQLSGVARGALAIRSLDALKDVAFGTDRLAVVTAPIDKHACHAAGFPHPGQTEFFETLWNGTAVMTLAGPKLRVGLVTNHLPLADVSARITRRLVESKVALFAQTLRDSFGIAAPRVAVCGVNPHASDRGLFGREDIDVVAPAIAAARVATPMATILGPLPADTAFYRAYRGDFDGVLAMYHDQGLGPLKTVHFDDAVNLSGGLAHFRASPDHGPAADLFLQRRASPKSFTAALDMAAQYLEART